jgi:hypothetical protein
LLSTDYIHDVLHEDHEDEDKQQTDDWEGGLTFTAKPSGNIGFITQYEHLHFVLYY